MSPVGNKNQARAFTLIELLVVIGLIAVLLGATLTIVPKVRKAVQGAQTSAQLAAIASAIQQYYNDFRAYPGPIPNSQLNSAYDSSSAPYISAATPATLAGTAGPAGMASFASAITLDPKHITGAENLVLGLCGGLHLVPQNTTPQTYTFEYHPDDIFTPDGITPLARGASNLGGIPRKQQAYISLNRGDISVPNNGVNNGAFTDEAGRAASDSMIPEFVDKFSNPLPILYFRTNVGSQAIAGFRNTNGTAAAIGSALTYTDPSSGNPVTVTAQYDLAQNIAYTNSTIGLIASNTNSMHGLKGLGNSSPMNDPIDTTAPGVFVPANGGSNGIAYFKDPTLNTANSTNTYQGTARQKDGFILISAGPDRQYGTRDDVIYPGPLQP